MASIFDLPNPEPGSNAGQVVAKSLSTNEGGLGARRGAQREAEAAAEDVRENTGVGELIGAAAVQGGIGFLDRSLQENSILGRASGDFEFPSDFQEDMEESGIHPNYWGRMHRAVSQEHYDRLKSWAFQDQMADQTRAQFGLTANILADFTDPVAFTLDAASGGLAYSARLSRLANAARSGVTAATLNAGLTAAQGQYNATIGTEEVLMSAGVGLALGGALGARQGEFFDARKIENIVKRDIVGSHESLSAARDNRLPDNPTPGLPQRELSDFLQEQQDRALDDIDIMPAFANVRLSLSARMGSAKSPLVRSASRWLFRDGVGHTDRNRAVQYSAGEKAELNRSILETKIQRGWVATVQQAREELGIGRFDRAAEANLAREIADGLRGVKPSTKAASEAVQRYRQVFDEAYDLGVRAGVLDPGTKAEDYFPQVQSQAAYRRIFGDMGLSMDQAVDVFKQSILSRMRKDAPDGGAQHEKMLDIADQYEGASPGARKAQERADGLQQEFGERQRELAAAEEALTAATDGNPRAYRAAKKRRTEAKRKLDRADQRFRDARTKLKQALEAEDSSRFKLREARKVADDGGIDEELAEAFARALVRRGQQSLDGGDNGFIRALKTDDIDALREMLSEAGITGAKADSILLPYTRRTEEGGKLGSSKQRIRLDPEFRTTVVNRFGKEVEIGVTDFLDNDVNRVATRYTREIAGWSAMAEVGNVRNRSELNALREEIRRDAKLAGDDPNSVLRMFDVGVNAILGRSTEKNPNGAYSRFARLLRETQFIRVMNLVGFTVFIELGVVAAQAGVRNTLRSLPAVHGYLKRAADGQLSTQEARWLEDLTAAGTGHLRNPVFMRFDDDGVELAPVLGDNAFGRGFENLSATAARATSVISGMAPLNTMLQRLSARATLLRLLDLANSSKPLGAATTQRLRNWGLDEADQAKLFGALKGKRKIDDIIEEDLDFETRQRISAFMFRVTRHQVLEGDASDSIMLMHDPTGKLLTQFRSFMMYSYERHFLNSIYNWQDWATWQMVGLTTSLAGLQWTARTYLSTIGDEERRERVLTKENFVKNAVAQSSWGAVIPAITDTAMDLTGNEQFFVANRTTGQSNNLLTGAPSVDFLMKARTAATLPAQMMRSDQEVTQREAQDFAKLFWFQNALGWSNVQQAAIKEMFPKTSEVERETAAEKRREEKREAGIGSDKPFLGIFH